MFNSKILTRLSVEMSALDTMVPSSLYCQQLLAIMVWFKITSNQMEVPLLMTRRVSHKVISAQ